MKTARSRQWLIGLGGSPWTHAAYNLLLIGHAVLWTGPEILAVNIFYAVVQTVSAQTPDAKIEPQFGQLKLTDAYINIGIEAESDKRTLPQAGITTKRDRLYVVPTLGVTVKGFIYHPNLLELRADGEGGVGVQVKTMKTTGSPQAPGTGSGLITLQRYDAEIRILSAKPYGTSLFAAAEKTFRNYDFFTRVKVDTDRYGLRSGYNAGPVPFQLMAYHQDEHVVSVLPVSQVVEDGVVLSGKVKRKNEARTEISGTVLDRTYIQSPSPAVSTRDRQVSVSDAEVFGADEWIKLNSNASYNQQKSARGPLLNVNESERLTLDHSDDVHSIYNYAFAHRASGPVVNQDHRASVELRHQLYESLTSSFGMRGQTLSTKASDNRLNINRYGVDVSESYTKRLGNWGRLTIGYTGRIGVEQRASLGQLLHVIAESVPLADSTITFLAQPHVDTATIRVTDNRGIIIFQEGLDYLITPHAALTEIRRVTGGAIPVGSPVFVSYDATAQASGQFETQIDQVQLRLALFGDRLGLYNRYNRGRNFGGQKLVLQQFSDMVAGLDVNSKWLRLGAEYEKFESNLSPFQSKRLVETFTFQPREASTLSFDFQQSRTTFSDTNQQRTVYSFIGRYQVRMGSYLSGSLEGGVRTEHGRGVDQRLTTARTGLDFRMGKLVAKLGYEFTDQVFSGELRQRNFFFFHARRIF